MSKVVFYAKPGAAKSVEEKTVLAAAGYEVEAHDLVAEHWTSASLRAFFDERPIVEWFDPAEPRVVSGEIDRARLNAQEALVTLALDPRLINGPLVRYNGSCAAGLDTEQLREFMDTRAQAGKSTPVRRLPRSWGESWFGE
jgi:ADP-ribosyl-[dinitrogen reductase] hydrolase